MPSTNHMGSDRSRKQWFELMLPHIPRCGEDEDTWVAGRALQAAAGLSEHQRSAGINWGRANYCPTRDWALVSGRRGYQFCQTTRQAASFAGARFKSVQTILDRTHKGVQMPLVKHLIDVGTLHPSAIPTAEKSLRRAMEDIADLSRLV
jgi:hypothetical protein